MTNTNTTTTPSDNAVELEPPTGRTAGRRILTGVAAVAVGVALGWLGGAATADTTVATVEPAANPVPAAANPAPAPNQAISLAQIEAQEAAERQARIDVAECRRMSLGQVPC